MFNPRWFWIGGLAASAGALAGGLAFAANHQTAASTPTSPTGPSGSVVGPTGPAGVTGPDGSTGGYDPGGYGPGGYGPGPVGPGPVGPTGAAPTFTLTAGASPATLSVRVGDTIGLQPSLSAASRAASLNTPVTITSVNYAGSAIQGYGQNVLVAVAPGNVTLVFSDSVGASSTVAIQIQAQTTGPGPIPNPTPAPVTTTPQTGPGFPYSNANPTGTYWANLRPMTSITLYPGDQNLNASPGAKITLNLPPGGVWTTQVQSYPSNITQVQIPTSGNAPGSFVLQANVQQIQILTIEWIGAATLGNIAGTPYTTRLLVGILG